MIFNKHYNLDGTHAYLSASKYAWINYDEEKLERVYETSQAARRGSEMHELAANLIRLGVSLPRNTKTLNQYVNDALGFRMSPEQILFYSSVAYGCCDAISYRNERGHKLPVLRIHDLKTGVSPASFSQLDIYAAFFCLEYRLRPFEMDIEFRIYQNDEVAVAEGDADTITRIMEKAKVFTKKLEKMDLEELGR